MQFANNEHFQNFVTLTILCAGVTVGVDTEMEGNASPYSERNLDVVLWYMDTVRKKRGFCVPISLA